MTDQSTYIAYMARVEFNSVVAAREILAAKYLTDCKRRQTLLAKAIIAEPTKWVATVESYMARLGPMSFESTDITILNRIKKVWLNMSLSHP